MKLSDFLKHQIIGYFRLKRQFPIACTEILNKDIIVGKITSDGIYPTVEIETKISFSDFKADFKKRKHLNPSLLGVDQFYFGVAPSIVNKVVSFLDERNSPYGVVSLPQSFTDEELIYQNAWDKFIVYRSAKKLENLKPVSSQLIFSRMSSELFRLQNRYLNECVCLEEGRKNEKH